MRVAGPHQGSVFCQTSPSVCSQNNGRHWTFNDVIMGMATASHRSGNIYAWSAIQIFIYAKDSQLRLSHATHEESCVTFDDLLTWKHEIRLEMRKSPKQPQNSLTADIGAFVQSEKIESVPKVSILEVLNTSPFDAR